MGIDCKIAFVSLEDELDIYLPGGCEIVKSAQYYKDEVDQSVTHVIENPWRYYGIGYERGPWPEISNVLLRLDECKEVGSIWYGGDSGGFYRLVDRYYVAMLTIHHMTYKEKPYREREFKFGEFVYGKTIREDLGVVSDRINESNDDSLAELLTYIGDLKLEASQSAN